jgi:hypothetical protein
MLAWETARTWWLDHSTIPFEDRLGWHLSCGLVYSTPSAFLMAEEVTWDSARQEIVPASNSKLPTPSNAWFVELAVLHGNPISLLLQVAPHPHDWVLFKRNNGFKIHAYRWSHLARRVGLHSLRPPKA